MLKRSLIVAALLLAMPIAHAQNTFPTPQTPTGGPTAGGYVVMCLNGSGQAIPCSNSTPLPVTGATGGSAVAPVVSSAAESNHVLKASAGSLLSLTTTLGATAGWVMVFDATSAPADGAVTPKYCWEMPTANTSLILAWPTSASFATGITVVFSSTGCFTKTGSATAFFSGQVQ